MHTGFTNYPPMTGGSLIEPYNYDNLRLDKIEDDLLCLTNGKQRLMLTKPLS